MTPAAVWLLRLYRRVQRWQALPGPGGLLAQEETLMRRLDLIQDLEDEHKREQEAIERARRQAEAAMSRLPGMRAGAGRVLTMRRR